MATAQIKVTFTTTFTDNSTTISDQVKALLSETTVVNDPIEATEWTVRNTILSADPLTEGAKLLDKGLETPQIPKLDIGSFVEEVKISAPGEVTFLAIVFDSSEAETVSVRFAFQPPKGPVEISLADVALDSKTGLAKALKAPTAALIAPYKLTIGPCDAITKWGKVYAGNDLIKLISKSPKDPTLSLYFVNANITNGKPTPMGVTTIVGWNKPTAK